MTEEIKAIIEKNLPAQVGTVLKEVLAQGEKDAAALKTAIKANEEAVTKITIKCLMQEMPTLTKDRWIWNKGSAIRKCGRQKLNLRKRKKEFLTTQTS